MIRILLISLLLISTSYSFAQETKQEQKSEQKKASKESDFQMKKYWFVMLTKGTNRNHDSATAAAIQKGHLDNINRLYDLGKILVAGPFGDDGMWRGIFIMDCKDQKEAEELLQTDPAIKAGRLAFEIHPWWTAKNEVFK